MHVGRRNAQVYPSKHVPAALLPAFPQDLNPTMLYTIYYLLYTLYSILYTLYSILYTLHYTILYYTILCYTILYYTILPKP